MSTTPIDDRDCINYKTVIKKEDELLLERRKKMAEKYGEDPEPLEKTRFGIALSGGGIRSATINLGLLRTLNMFHLLRKADYLSTVSGGGYTGAYIQAMLKEKGDYEELFDDANIQHMRLNGEYLIPGQTVLTKLFNTILLAVGYLASLVMNLLSPAILVGVIFLLYRIVETLVLENLTWDYAESYFGFLTSVLFPTFIGVVVLHFFGNLFVKYSLRVSHFFNLLETAIVTVALLLFVPVIVIYLNRSLDNLTGFIGEYELTTYIAILLGLIILGMFNNTNAISFHRFYRNKLARTFLGRTPTFRNVKLKDLFQLKGKENDWIAPYPLINTCLNFQNLGGGQEFKGSKAFDYFLLSPKFCGAKLTGYVQTDKFPGYNAMSLPAATTISAAAINPGMGIYSNKLASIFITLFNFRLGYWVNNPLKNKSNYLVWWPFYFFYELLSKVGPNNRKVNISDGGHIENLGVYELLRRKCRLILAVDGGADPKFDFFDLNNLTIRARNELGVEIKFRDTLKPEEVLKVRPSEGYSNKRFVVADLYQIWEEFDLEDENGNILLDAEEEPFEVLVNYIPEGTLAPEVFVKGAFPQPKGEKGGKKKGKDQEQEVDVEAYRNELRQLAYAMVERKLAAKEDLKGKEKLKFGTLVYVKSTVTAPTLKPFIARKKKKEEERTVVQKAVNYVVSFFKPVIDKDRDFTYDTYKYKVYHPAFPHESTADQFFDPVQWESYYQLGQFIGGDVLNVSPTTLMRIRTGAESALPKTIAQLIEEFDAIGVPKTAPAFVRAQKPQPKAPKPEQPAVEVKESVPPAADGDEHVGYCM